MLGSPIAGRSRTPEKLAHLFAAEVLKCFTTEDRSSTPRSRFRASTVGSRADDVDWDGADVRQVTRNGSQNYLPGWSPRATRCFTPALRGSADLWRIPSAGGRKAHLDATWHEHRRRLFADQWRDRGHAVVPGQQRIYLLNSDGEVLSRLTNNPASIARRAFTRWQADCVRL